MAYRYPFTPFPNGWYMVALASDLPRGSVHPLRYFGRDLALVRTETGVASLLDAHCPHLGAHLGHGTVRGENVRCAFHGWCFDPQGTCVEVPFAKKVPPKARVAAWPLAERNGVLMAFHHRGGAAPSHELPLVPEVTSEEWTAPVPHVFRMRTHVQEIAENVIDLAHTRFLHGMEEELTATRFEPEGEILRFTLEGRSTRMDAELHGLGFQLYRFRTDLGEGTVEFTHMIMPAPVDEDYIDWRVLHMVKRAGDDATTRRIEENVSSYIDTGAQADLEIFEHKSYVSAPVLSDADGPIMPLRRWAQQFYD
jgi:phenylpropionate dioxygenase-like ring-hydroxylating dioxygenase large terminal subunit